MRKVYEDQDMTMVGYYQGLLEREGIATLVKNEYAQLAMGEVPFTQVYPELWVENEVDYKAAVELIRRVREDSENKEEVLVNYRRSWPMQLVMWFGTFLVVLILTWGICQPHRARTLGCC